MMSISFFSDIVIETCPVIASGIGDYDDSSAYVIFHIFIYYLLVIGFFTSINNKNMIN